MNSHLSLLFLGIIFLSLSACNMTADSSAENEELAKVKAEKEQLEAEASNRDQMITEYIEAVNQIEANLEEIKKREGLITLDYKDVELQKTREEQIAEDINAIGRLMEENRKKVAGLQAVLKASNNRIQGLEEMVARLTGVLAEKDLEIHELREELLASNQALEDLFSAYNASLDVITEQIDALNTAWFAFGSAKELKTNGVITKEGGFIGIGGAQKLKDDFNQEYFKQIDITKVTTLDLYGKKAKLITTHPSDSYKLTGEGKAVQLVIQLPEKFWSASKYLVVQVD